MSPLRITFFLVALSSPTCFSAKCRGSGACTEEHEETSLVQIQSNLKQAPQMDSSGSNAANFVESNSAVESMDQGGVELQKMHGAASGPVSFDSGGSTGDPEPDAAAAAVTDKAEEMSKDAAKGEGAGEGAGEAKAADAAAPAAGDKAAAGDKPAGNTSAGNAESVTGAFKKNFDKAKDKVANLAEEDVKFQKKTHEARKADHEKNKKKVEDALKAVKKARKDDKKLLYDVQRERKLTKENARDKVKAAKKKYDKIHKKRKQVELASQMGKQLGAQQGQQSAIHAIEEYRHQMAKERMDELKAQKKEMDEEHKKDVEQLGKEKSDMMSQQEDSWASQVKRAAEREEERMQAQTDAEQLSIMGSAGLGNKLSEAYAGLQASQYDNLAELDQNAMTDGTGFGDLGAYGGGFDDGSDMYS